MARGKYSARADRKRLREESAAREAEQRRVQEEHRLRLALDGELAEVDRLTTEMVELRRLIVEATAADEDTLRSEVADLVREIATLELQARQQRRRREKSRAIPSGMGTRFLEDGYRHVFGEDVVVLQHGLEKKHVARLPREAIHALNRKMSKRLQRDA